MAVVAAVTTFAATFAVRVLARRFSIIVVPDERRVHERPTPTVGGAAMFVGLLAAMATASQLKGLRPVFRGSSEPIGLVVAATVIFAVGMFDDLREMSPPAKMSGQVLSGTVLYFAGISMLFFKVPLLGTTLSLSPALVAVMTVVWVVGMANAVNFIDGLDGLAAGIVAIASLAFFLYSHQLVKIGTVTPENSGPLIAVVVLGMCIGFLPHNFHPAKIFMGDAGAMLLGLLMAATTMSVVGQTGNGFSGRTYFFYAPIFIPFFILGIPMLDTAFAIVRRAGRRTGMATADKNHLHHRLMRLGHGQTRSVLILWTWTALLSGLVLVPALTNHNSAFIPAAILGLGVALYTLFTPRGRGGVANRPGAADDDGAGGDGAGPADVKGAAPSGPADLHGRSRVP
ncbi:undecaprenyl/decaprenyl-phosphate alpha-N-acetylglucosaminyl 1-phosphate transferase [Acidiferrimicrobium sp. IK]|uniref:glycosyltransferase family 4 protein n=1 Tax=Acidiferrimicrobium sp. IK TaxID=2871700 RepID=UPI0021CAE9E3|nr:MraY family glycosyltransferase [Acidiferrimicrobium sp. IK]MCU4186485.1 undecaprenyl/decaprenyl-phosphate alpha-N-acetylglucosaminyl 1-phosphate transferase [Acidiferrimicrobium sp. IK]